MDFIVGLSKSQNKDVILVVVDMLSTYAHFISLSHPYTAQDVAQLFLDQVFKLHGLPKVILTDKDPIFTSIMAVFVSVYGSTASLTFHLSPTNSWKN
jgi:hypothetical protein